LEVIEPFYLAKLFEDQGLAIISEFRYMPKNKQEDWKQFIQDWRQEKDWREQERKIDEFVSKFTDKLEQQRPLKRNLRPVLELDNPAAPNVVQDVMYHLSRGRLVVLDLSLMPLEQALLIADLVLNGIFNYNIRGITVGRVINTIAVFEEAQNVLNKEAVEKGNTIFARWAKEGRKFQLGLMYVTQQPGAIAEEIVSQTDNFFVMHLLNKGDINALKKANPHYDGAIADFLGRETFVGNTYIYSAPVQPYVFPAKVFEFGNDFFATLTDKIKTEIKSGKSVLNELQDIAKILQSVVTKQYGERRKFVGAYSRQIYQYFKNNSVSAPFIDDENKWIDYEVAEHLIWVLEKRGLLNPPSISGESASGSEGF